MKIYKYYLLIIGFLLMATAILNAQDNIEETEYKAIPIAQLPDFISTAQIKAYEITQIIDNDENIKGIDEKLKAISTEINSNSKLIDSILLVRLSLNELEKWDRMWNTTNTLLMEITMPIERKVADYESLYHDINYKYQVLLETSIELKNASLDSEIKLAIQTTKKQLREVRTHTKNKQLQYITYKSDCNFLTNKILVELDKIKTARSKIVRSLLIAEQPDLWQAIKQAKNDTLIIHEQSNFNYAIANTKTYWKNNKSVSLILLFSFLFFYFLINFLIRNTNNDEQRKILKDNRSTDVIINRPILSSIIMSGFVFKMSLYLPEEINAIWLTLVLTPIILVIKQLFKKQTATFLITFSAYYILRSYAFLIDESSIQARFATIIIALISILVIKGIFNQINKNSFFEKWRHSLRFVLFTLLILQLSCLTFNLIGNVRLSTIILIGSIDVVIAGILILIIYNIVMGVIEMIFLIPHIKVSNIIKHRGHEILANIRKIISLFFIIYWVVLSFSYFGIQDEVLTYLKTVYYHKFIFGNTSFALNNIIAFVFAIYLSFKISNGIKLFLEEEVFSRKQTNKGTSGTILLLIRYSIISLGFVIAMAAAGIEMDKISIIIGSLGVGIGFGLQSVFNNLVSGIILAVERPIAVGDIIEVGTLTGIVQEIGFRSSRVKTYDGAEVIVPNGDIVSNQMINWTLSDRKRRLKIDFGVSYDSNPDEVIEVMKEITHENPSIVQDPAPRPRFVAFGDSSLNFQLLFWISDYENSFGIGTETMLKLYNKLKERGIQIPFPQRDIRIVDVTQKDIEKVLKKE